MHAPLNAAELRRVMYRASLFASRGIATDEADQVAFDLCERDRQRDDRRMCVECSNWQTGRRGDAPTCFARQKLVSTANDARSLGEKPTPLHALSPIQPIATLLQRCAGFEFQTP